MNYWPHAPMHKFTSSGIYMVTAGTYLKKHHFNSSEKLTLIQNKIFELADEFEWELQAWAIMVNHYHLIARSRADPKSLSSFIGALHRISAKELNQIDGTPGRRVWYQYWDRHLSFEKSYLARLNYVNQNPVKHGIVEDATKYRWCSAAWFEETADRPFRRTVESFKIDRVNVFDDF
ncbi:MAG: hypothetical protein K940chlam7_01249 [Chlamydiae bacterium]|nr:hypothetical protein [Chlamydiota bacterium]